MDNDWRIRDKWKIGGKDINWNEEYRTDNAPSVPEAMAYMVRAKSYALGADDITSIYGYGEIAPMGKNVDLNELGVGKSSYDHSAEFLSNITKRGTIWNHLLLSFETGGIE